MTQSITPARSMSTCDVAVAGGGPAGLLCALLAAQAGAKTVLIAKPPGKAPDGRTVALMQGSLALLESIGVWQSLRTKAAPLRRLRLIDGTNRLLRAPTVIFEARELGLDAFGANIPNADLQNTLMEQLQESNVDVRFSTIAGVSLDETRVELRTGSLHVSTRLAVAADGRHSLLREATGIGVRQWSYPQNAVTAILRHSAPHQDTSSEFHTETGPLTLVPLPGDFSSLVAVTAPEDAKYLMNLPDEAFGDEIERRSCSLLGRFKLASKRSCWPLEGLIAERFAQRRVALVGEAAHVLPPIGAQGLNLGFRDAHLLAKLAGDALHRGENPGGDNLLSAYHNGRRADIRLRSFAVDTFNRSLLAPFLPVHLLRGLGLYLAGTMPALRKPLMQLGLAANDSGLLRVS